MSGRAHHAITAEEHIDDYGIALWKAMSDARQSDD